MSVPAQSTYRNDERGFRESTLSCNYLPCPGGCEAGGPGLPKSAAAIKQGATSVAWAVFAASRTATASKPAGFRFEKRSTVMLHPLLEHTRCRVGLFHPNSGL